MFRATGTQALALDPFFALLTLALVLEARTAWMQSRLLSAMAGRMTFQVKPGPNPRMHYPQSGPYDDRLGHAKLPQFQDALIRNGFDVTAQARSSPLLKIGTGLSLFPIYAEKNQAGLRVLDRFGHEMFEARFPRHAYDKFESIPPVLVSSLLFVENREILDPETPYRNPAIEWSRFGRALIDLGIRKIDSGYHASGGSTLATQIEKIRHSPEGRTQGAGEKLRQMASASLRAYQDGEATLPARKRIIRDYLNSLPLASLPRYGEIFGIGDGLTAWYGTNFEWANYLLSLSDEAAARQNLELERAAVYRQALSLVLAIKKPSVYLQRDPKLLDLRVEGFLNLLAGAEIISEKLRDNALRSHPVIGQPLARQAALDFTARKATDGVRNGLLTTLGLLGAYDLDRLDLTVNTTLDQDAGNTATELLQNLADPANAMKAGIIGERLLSPASAKNVIYSFTLYERTGKANVLRVQADNLNQPLNVNDGTKLELGSTAKLRTLVTYLEIIAELHARYSGQRLDTIDSASLHQDKLTQWAVEYLLTAQDKSLKAMLRAAMNRKYSANPGETFFTGGGAHVFANFDSKDNGLWLTLHEGLQRSVNLVFIRLMRDIVNYQMYRTPGVSPSILEDPEDPIRRQYLERFAEFEGTQYLKRFYRKYAGQNEEQVLQTLARGMRQTPRRLAVAYRSLRPEATFEQFLEFTRSQPVGRNLPPKLYVDLYEKYPRDKFNLNDRGYLSRVHPLELWMLEYRRNHPDADLTELLGASTRIRQDVYQWLLKSRFKRAQDIRIRTLLEREAFERILPYWKRQGYPFNTLVPSYATAIGSSGDNPAALATLAGIIQNDGMRYPSIRINQLHFAEGTAMETVMRQNGGRGERVLAPEIAAVVKGAMQEVVEKGTARRVYQCLVLRDGTKVAIGGKTGTGDNRIHSRAGSKALNRTATFVFVIGDRFYGTLVAYVPGAEAASYGFTSALPVQIFKQLVPALKPLFEKTVIEPAAAQMLASVSTPGYSYRNASTGSSRAALLAGQMPKNNPTPTETITPATAAHIGTAVGSVGNTMRAISEIIQPKSMPSNPPANVSTVASVRN